MSRRSTLSRLLGTVLLASVVSAALAQETPPTPSAPLAEAEQTLAGLWDLRIDGTTIFRFAIIPEDGGGWRGRWSRPDDFNSNGNAFANLSGGVKTTDSMAGNAVFELVELAFDDPRPGAVPDVFRFRQTGPDTADMLYVGTQLAPYRLVRAGTDDPLGNWDSTRIYRRPPPPPRPAIASSVRAAPAQPVGPQDRVILGPSIRFLDLTPRAVETPAPDAAEAEPASAPAPDAPDPAPPAPAAAPAPAPASAPTPATTGGVDESFFEGL